MVIGGLCGGIPVAFSIAEKKLGFSIGSHIVYPVIGLFPAVIGALGPDIDMPNSKAGAKVRRLLLVSIVISGLLLLFFFYRDDVHFFLPLFLAFCCISLFVFRTKHRQGTHCGLLMIVLFLPNIYIVRFTQASPFINSMISAWLGFCFGWFSHLVVDTFNRKGVPWLYPFSRHYFRLAKIAAGTKGETVFRTFCVVLFTAAYMVIIIFRSNIVSIFL
jgi:inner membrane protein